MTLRLRLASTALLLTTSAIATGGESGEISLPPELVACAAETDVLERLSCYDRAMEELLTAEAAPPQAEATMPAPAPEPPAPDAAARVADVPSQRSAAPAAVPAPRPAVTGQTPEPAGLPPAPAARPTPAGKPADMPPPVESAEPDGRIVATVTELRERPYGELIILLDNGQIWEQKHRDNRFRLRVGDEVTISKGLVSGYRLSGRGNNSIQVERLK